MVHLLVFELDLLLDSPMEKLLDPWLVHLREILLELKMDCVLVPLLDPLAQ